MNSGTGDMSEESDVRRRAFMTGGTASMAAASLGIGAAPRPPFPAPAGG